LGDTKPSQDRIAALVATHRVDELTTPGSPARRELEQTPGVREALRALGANDSQRWAVRFAAYEALFAIGGTLDDPADRRSAARTYATELANGESHNYWGLPGEQLSGALRTFAGLGKDAAIPALLPLLEDRRALVYEGSQEPTLSEAFGYRVADLAGTVTATLLGTSFPVRERDPAKRDVALAALRNAATAAMSQPRGQ